MDDVRVSRNTFHGVQDLANNKGYRLVALLQLNMMED
jgi:hypothetical protein